MRLPNLFGSLSLLAFATSCGLLPSAKVIPRLGTLDLKGELIANSTGITTTADMEDLGFLDDGKVFEPRVDLAWGPIDIILSGYQANYEGDGTAEFALDLGGTTIAANADVHSELEITTVGAVVVWDLVPTDLVDIGIGLGVQAIDFDASITDTTLNQTIETSEAAPFPVVAARVAVQIFDLEVSAVASGVSLEYDGLDATYVDLDLMASWTFEEFLGFHGALVAGYRQISLEAEYEDDDSDVLLDFDLTGPYFGLSLGL